MRERPILFSGPMVCAILAGDKTQTRRIVKPQPNMASLSSLGKSCFTPRGMLSLRGTTNEAMPNFGEWHYKPYAFSGDRLWVKETIVRHRSPGEHGPHAYYAADDKRVLSLGRDWKWRRDLLSSIHCPRALSRITLEVIDLRIERLQAISEEDAAAEGVPTHVVEHTYRKIYRDAGERRANRINLYRELWDSLNEKRAPWASNPWVWVVEFRRVEAAERAS